MAPWHSAFRCFACIVGLYGLASTSDLVSGSPTPITHSCIDICSRLQPQDNTRVRWICGCWGMFAAVPKREHVSGGVCFRGHAELIHGITTLCMCVSVPSFQHSPRCLKGLAGLFSDAKMTQALNVGNGLAGCVNISGCESCGPNTLHLHQTLHSSDNIDSACC
jgi:hypothetical protein